MKEELEVPKQVYIIQCILVGIAVSLTTIGIATFNLVLTWLGLPFILYAVLEMHLQYLCNYFYTRNQRAER